MLSENLIQDFIRYSEKRNWKYDSYTTECTIQFRLTRFFDYLYNDLFSIELESNIHRYGITEKLQKKEIDIDILNTSSKQKNAIELKYIRDLGSYDIGFYNTCVDIKFLEQLKGFGYKECDCLILTNIQQVYSSREKNRASELRKNLYDCFQKKFCISGKIYRKENHEINFDKKYPIKWFDFTDSIKACIIQV